MGTYERPDDRTIEHALMHFDEQARSIKYFIIRVREGIYIAHFRRSSVDITECKSRYSYNRQNQGQLWPEPDMLMQCTRYKRTICLSFIFAYFALYISEWIKTWRITMSHIIFILPRHWWAESKTRQKQYVVAKINLYPLYTSGKAWKMEPINLAMIVKPCEITWDALRTSLMVAQHTYKHLRFISRSLQIVHCSCENTKGC